MSSRTTLKLSAALAAVLLLPALALSAQTAAPAPPPADSTAPAAGTQPAAQTQQPAYKIQSTAPADDQAPSPPATQANTPAPQQAPAVTPIPAATTPATPAAPAPGTTATTGSLRGRAVDPTGAVIPGTNITLAGPRTYTTQSTGDGTYLIPDIAPGTYTVTTQIPGFTVYTKANIKIAAGVMAHQNLHLNVEVTTVVNVKANDPTALSVNPDSNSSALILTGNALDALSDDPDELSDELSALAGPAAGPNGGQIYIDGFTGGTLPPKSSIREIRINQNPFSAEYDKIGYGRVEVFTKPGTDKLHGSVQMQGNSDVFNTAALVGGVPQPPYHTLFFQGSLTGPISKKASYNIGSNFRQIEDNNVVDTTVTQSALTPGSANYQPFQFFQSIFFPQTRIDLSPRLDLQLTSTNTLTARYQFDHNSSTNAGTGASKLANSGYNTTSVNNQIQLSDSQSIGAKFITETRFEYYSSNYSQTVQDPFQSINVQGAFKSNGNPNGNESETSTHYELQSYSSVALKNNFIRFGGRLRHDGDNDTSNFGFYGTFAYGQTLPTYDAALQADYHNAGYDLPSSLCFPGAGAAGTVIPVSGICNYGLSQYYANNPGVTPHAMIGPILFTANFGNPNVTASITDLGLYVEDDWKARPNLTLTAGLRYETQNHISDHSDFAPRLSLAWGLGGVHGGSPAFVVRAGFGVFYDRFALGQIENVNRFSGVNGTQQVDILNPTGTCTPAPTNAGTAASTAACIAGAPASTQITYSQAPNLRAPYIMQSSASIEHNLFKSLTTTLTYLNSRGEHQFFQQNTARNTVPASGANVYQYVSEGIFKQNQLILQATYRGPLNTSLFGYYVFSHANGDVTGTSSIAFPSSTSPNNITADYGRASFDIRHKVFFGGSASFPHYIQVSPFLIAQSGTPFNITLGEDLNGDTVLNDRPGFANCNAPVTNTNRPAANTKYGCLNLATQLTDPRIPINYGISPAAFTMNVRVTKTFGFGAYTHGQPGGGGHNHNGGGNGGAGQPPLSGPGGTSRATGAGRGGGPMGFGGGGGANTGRRYNITVGAQALNLFNVVNYDPPQSVLSSPLFGHANQLAGGIFSSNTAVRRITLQMNFTF